MKITRSSSKYFFLMLAFSGLTACATVSGEKAPQAAVPDVAQNALAASGFDEKGNVLILSKIEIQTGSPSEAVRNFYKLIREKRFVDAMMLTNMKAAVESLSLEETKELAPDFEPLAAQVPASLVITGEQVSGDKASVFLKLPGEEGAGNPTSDEIKLRKEGESWVILSGDEKDESAAKKQGKSYFFNVRIEMHQQEVPLMFERIIKAEEIFSAQGKGLYGDRDVLIREGLLPVDISGSYTTGYNFSIVISSDKKSYFVNAVPAVYGKSGKLSYMMEVNGGGAPKTKSSDNGGMPLKR
jgi:hypothetical protein